MVVGQHIVQVPVMTKLIMLIFVCIPKKKNKKKPNLCRMTKCVVRTWDTAKPFTVLFTFVCHEFFKTTHIRLNS